MTFKDLISSYLSNANSSVQITNPPHTPVPSTSLHPHGTNSGNAIRRIFECYHGSLSDSIKTVPRSLTNRMIHTRLKTRDERFIILHKELERTKFELKVSRCLRQRQKRIAFITEQRYAQLRLIEVEEHKTTIENVTEKMEYWKYLANEHEDRMFKIGEDVLNMTDAALTSAKNIRTLRAERDEICADRDEIRAERDEIRAQLVREREHAKLTASHCKMALSSLRKRLELEKALSHDEFRGFRESLRSKDQQIAELNEFCEGSVQEIEDKDRQITRLESSETVDSISREMSCILSEMSEVVLFGQKDWQNLSEKMKALRDGMKDLVSEVQSGREYFNMTM